MEPELLKDLITILETNKIEPDNRFKLLEKCYLEKNRNNKNSKYIKKFDVVLILNEIERLMSIEHLNVDISIKLYLKEQISKLS